MPFVTETVWKKFKSSDLIIEKWPKKIIDLMEPLKFSGFENTIEIIKAIRAARAENKIEPARKIKAIIYAGKFADLIKSQEHLIKNMRTGIKELEIKEKAGKIKNRRSPLRETAAGQKKDSILSLKMSFILLLLMHGKSVQMI